MRRRPGGQTTHSTKEFKLVFLLIPTAGDERKVFGAAADRRIGFAAARDGRVVSSIDAARGQTFAVYSLDKDARDFL